MGLIPWVPLTDFADPPETVLRRCRDVIEQQAPAGEKANLLAVTHVLASLRYDVGLLALLGGKKAMLESPWIQELVTERVAEGRQRDILAVIQTRFGEVPRDLAEEIELVVDDDQLTALVRKAVACPSLESLRNEIER